MKMRPSTNTSDVLNQRWKIKKDSKTDFIIADDETTVAVPDPIAITSLSAAIAEHIVELHNASLS